MINIEHNPLSRLYDHEAERAVIGSCLIDPDAITKVAAVVKADDFQDARYKYIFAAIQSLADRGIGIDFTLLQSELDDMGILMEVGGPAILTDTVAMTPTAMYADHYAGIVAEKATMRRLHSAVEKIAQSIYADGSTSESVLDEFQRLMLEASKGKIGSSIEHVSGIMERVMLDLEENRGKPSGLSTGFTDLDNLLGGLHGGHLVILAARPGMGKSGLAMNIAESAAKQGKGVSFFSLEMTDEQLAHRLLSGLSGVDSYTLRGRSYDDAQLERMRSASADISTLNLYIDASPSLSVDQLRRTARLQHSKSPLGLVVVDYLQLAEGKGDIREQQVSYISRNLKGMANELNVPVLALSQLNRDNEKRADKMPMLSDLRESGSQEQDADAVIFIHRDDYYNDESDRQNIADIKVAKNRHGATGTVSLFFRKELAQFRDLEIVRTDLEY